MRVGVSLSSASVADNPRDGARWIIERAGAADRAELDSLSLGDHHVMASTYFQNTPMLGRLLAEWGPRPVGCLFLLPLWHPVLVAEHVGTLAALTDATFIVQTGIGDGATQFAAMGASLRNRGVVLEESIRVVRALLAGDAVESELLGGPAVVNPRPHQRVEWWISAGSAPVALERAGRLGDAWYASPALTLAEAAPMLATYRESCARHDKPARPILRRDVIVLDDGAEAERLGTAMLAAGYRGLSRDAVAFGTPAMVAEQLSRYRDLGFTDVICRCMSVPQREALETIESLAEVRTLLATP